MCSPFSAFPTRLALLSLYRRFLHSGRRQRSHFFNDYFLDCWPYPFLWILKKS